MANKQYYGVIGAGSFGTAVANLLALNVEVLLLCRDPKDAIKINETHRHLGVDLHERIQATTDFKALAEQCTTIFPIVPSGSFRGMMKQLGPFLTPAHILIHGTKGFDVYNLKEPGKLEPLLSDYVHSMSQVILQESPVRRVGCLSGPNLATEIMEGQPTATVVASKFIEVINIGKQVLTSPSFKVYGSRDILGAELAGALKNIIAIGSGILRGKGLGKNIEAMLITHGLLEMVRFGQTFGSSTGAFYGTAGVGDLIATATSKNSRNFTFGYRLGNGESVQEIQETMPELAEGVRTLEITYTLARRVRLKVPIIRMLHRVVFEDYDIEDAIQYLLAYPYDVDIDLSL
ncbi:MAG: NAD(P)H-dependent glycerol-3-phosphate dehydrogenase [Saprospiraceae bacterium]